MPPRALFGTPDEQFVPGTYYLDEVSGFPTPKISITLGDGWSNLRDGVTIDGRGGVMAELKIPAQPLTEEDRAAGAGGE